MCSALLSGNPVHKSLHQSAKLTLLITGVALFSGCSMMDKTQSVYDEDGFTRGVYAGAGIGASRLEPDASQVANYTQDDRVEPAGQLTVGVDVSKHLAIEAHTADLGSAGFSPEGRINYHIDGASALVYAGANRDRYKRQGLTAFGRVGVGSMENSSVGQVQFENVNGTQVLVGAGVEYMTPIGLGLRAEGISFDEDAQYAQLGLIYRAAPKRKRAPLAVAEQTVIEEQMAEPVEEPIIAAAIDHCASAMGDMNGVQFNSDSAGLRMDAVNVLNQVATKLNQCPELRLEILGHTDSTGTEPYNQTLSEKRAESVADYLTSKGISRSRLTATAFGEASPRAGNQDSAGRAQNRRVELLAR